MSRRAIFIRQIDTPRAEGDMRLYQLVPPVEAIMHKMYCFPFGMIDRDGPAAEYVVVSAIPYAHDNDQPETFIFKANPEGEIDNWTELQGSFVGAMDHARALAGLGDGYEIVEVKVDVCEHL